MIDKNLTINELVEEAHKNARDKGFWDFCIQETDEMFKTDCVLTNEIHRLTLILITNGFLTLIASEVFEAQQALRKNDRANFKEEIADIFIRAADLCGGLGIDIEKEIIKKLSDTIHKLDDNKKNYILGVAEGMAMVRESEKTDRKE